MKPHHGGKYQYTLSFINALSEKNLIVLSSIKEWRDLLPKKFIFHELKKDGFHLKLIRHLLRLSNLGLIIIRKFGDRLFNLNKCLKKLNPDFVVFPGGENMSYESIYPSITPVFDIMHKYERFPEISSFLTLKLRDIHYKNVLKYCSKIIVDSELGAKQLFESYDKKQKHSKKIHKLYYTYPSYIDEFKGKKKALYNFNYIFYPAQFWAHKNHIHLVNALKILINKKNDFKLILVGSKKNNYNKVVEHIKNLNLWEHIIILDYVSNENLVNLYENAFCCVMPSFLGPTNIPQIESIALNCPVIVSDIYASREQMEDAALYIDPNDPNDISEKILSLNNISLRNKLIKNGNLIINKLGNQKFKENLIKILYS